MCTSLAISVSSSRETGMPVHLRDDLGDVVGVDVVAQVDRRLDLVAAALVGLGQRALELGDLAVAQLGRALVVELALGALELVARLRRGAR